MQAGDNEAFAVLYAATVRGLYAFLYPYFRNRADTEDALHTVYLRVKRYCGNYRAHTDARAWLLQVAKNHALNELRRRRRECPLDESAPIPARPEPSEGLAFAALNAALNESEREVVVMHVLWGYKHREIAAAEGIPLGTVTSRYKTAIGKMRAYIEKEERHA